MERMISGRACNAVQRELGFFQLVDGGEVAVGQHGIGQRTEMLRRLELGRVPRQEEHMHMVGDVQPHAGVLPRPIQDEHNLLGGAGAARCECVYCRLVIPAGPSAL